MAPYYRPGTRKADKINGTALEDLVEGFAGPDVMDGGKGNDTLSYVSSAKAVTVSLATGRGKGGDAEGDSFKNFENITGSAFDDVLTGDKRANVLDGGAGADRMSGGKGNDRYIVDNAGDTVTESAKSGTDHVFASINYTLGANLERLTLTGSAVNGTGNALNNRLTGNELANTLNGGAGDDRLDGGAGNDTLIGGTGHDTYYVEDAGDIVTELEGQGTDTVFVSGLSSYALTDFVENLTITGDAATNGFGNGLANVITGNDSNNTLEGAGGDDTLYGNGGADVLRGGEGNDLIDGGTGADVMEGGKGDDTYYVNNAADSIYESASDNGIDTIYSSVSFTLPDFIERLVLVDSATNATGNDFSNTLIGNKLDNVLNGYSAADFMSGGAGDDTYIVDSLDVLTEKKNEGTDTVRSDFSWTLGDNFENLVLTGSGNTSGAGNGLRNVITGNSGDNAIGGGKGNDLLTGGGGNDRFLFASGDGSDTVTDFEIGKDKIDLSLFAANQDSGISPITAANFSSMVQMSYSATTCTITVGAGEDMVTISLRNIASGSQLSQSDFLLAIS